ncbi:hypothetical protein K461DRAFT_265307 [Myriangium duriaei CBS 260.36]|uniref:Uncharacterized protein n=1 Tax=Myriangium duriaei CBS 260.36 TaxID=1168546 RepID=A0A9P4J816_9PEZI|nr:hypothetical protein K461DRAFT_265307 [Myriangium duriaei CBS 260.36]
MAPWTNCPETERVLCRMHGLGGAETGFLTEVRGADPVGGGRWSCIVMLVAFAALCGSHGLQKVNNHGGTLLPETTSGNKGWGGGSGKPGATALLPAPLRTRSTGQRCRRGSDLGG